MPGARITSGERVTLRTVEREDVPFHQRAFTDPEIRLPLGNPLRNREEIDVPTGDRGSDQFLVCLDGDGETRNARDSASGRRPRADDAGSGQLGENSGSPEGSRADGSTIDDVRRLGVIYVGDADYKRPELGYWLVPEAHGQGYGKESVALVIEYVFGEYDTPAVGAEAFDFNDASRGLLESLGFVEEGRRRKFMFVDGEHRDMVQYGLLREEWRERD